MTLLRCLAPAELLAVFTATGDAGWDLKDPSGAPDAVLEVAAAIERATDQSVARLTSRVVPSGESLRGQGMAVVILGASRKILVAGETVLAGHGDCVMTGADGEWSSPSRRGARGPSVVLCAQ